MTAVDHSSRPLPSFDSRPDLPVALVIGAGGLSMAIGQRLGQSHRVVLASLYQQELDVAQQRLHELGVVSATVRCDITSADSVGELSDKVAGFGPVQTLAHVAAVSPSTADWRTIFSVNLIGAARVEHAMQPLMAPGGAAVFISSSGGHRPPPAADIIQVLDDPLAGTFFPRLAAALSPEPSPGMAYSLSKWALNRLVRRQAPAWGRRHTRILSISPGIIDTLMGAAADVHASRETKAAMRTRLPLGRDGAMAEIADAVEFLTSARASYITGTDLLVDGGLCAALSFPG